MSFMGSMMGGGGGGANFKAQSANVVNPVTDAQTQQAYQDTQQALQAQQQFMQALQSQNGIQNQSAVFNQQQSLANQIQGMTQGQGPNPAQAQLAQATSANTQNQAALMAGQRGAGQNVGMIARQAGQQGAANQQNSIGQAATLAAQQQLNAVGALQGQQQAMGQTAGAEVGELAGATSAYNQFAQGEQQNLFGAIANANNANVANASQQNQANASIASQVAKTQGGMMGGLLNGAGAAAGLFATGGMSGIGGAMGGGGGQGPMQMFSGMAAKGGEITDQGVENPKLAESHKTPEKQELKKPKLHGFAKKLIMKRGGKVPQEEQGDEAQPVEIPNHVKELMNFARGGMVPVLISPGEKVAMPGNQGLKVVPGKAKVKGDSEKNDTVKASLPVGAIVVPRTKAKDPEKTDDFIKSVKSKKKK